MAKDTPHQFELLLSIFRDTAGELGEGLLRAMVRGLGEVLDAETTFVARALDHPASRVQVLAAWKDGNFRDSWEYDLAGNPCLLTYNGEPTFIPCEIGEQFPNKKDSGYESYIGVPLKGAEGEMIGHIAIYASKTRPFDDFAVELARICGIRAELEILRLIDDHAKREKMNRLSKSNQEQDDLLALAGHELRSPLASVIFTLDAIQTGIFGEIPENVNDYVSGALGASEKLLAMTNDILDQQRIAAGNGSVSSEPVVLGDLIADAVEQLRALADQNEVTFDIRAVEENISINADPILLERLFRNLISNAIKFSPENGKIELEAATHEGAIRVAVKDHGPGIAKELHDHIFERFARGPTTDDKIKGTGLGLSIARTIAEAHGGNIHVESELGAGSSFVVLLPKSLSA